MGMWKRGADFALRKLTKIQGMYLCVFSLPKFKVWLKSTQNISNSLFFSMVLHVLLVLSRCLLLAIMIMFSSIKLFYYREGRGV